MAVTTDSEKPADEKYMKILKLMVDNPTNYNKIMETAAYYGHIEIVKLMLEKGAKNYDSAMSYAASSGHIEIVKLMLEKGAKNYDSAIKTAAMYEHTEIVKFLQEHQKNQKVECSNNAEINLLKKENELLKKENESLKLKLNKIQEIII